MRATSQNTSVTTASQLHQLDFVTFRRVDERKAGAVLLHVLPYRIFDAILVKVILELSWIINLDGEMREVRLHLNRAAVGERADLDQFFAARRFQENKL